MSYNLKCCSFYPNNFDASALRSEYDDNQASLTRHFQRFDGTSITCPQNFAWFVASTFYLKLCLEMYVGR